MELLTSILALVAGVGAILLVIAALLGVRAPFARPIVGWAHRRRNELTLAVSGVATLGSLYFSEIADYIPCRLCWFQRIFMYPLALIALVALIRRDRESRWYILPFAVIGAGVSLYHFLIEQGVVPDSDSCSLFGPACAEVWFTEFGFVSLAFMALCGFVAIAVVNLLPAPSGASSDSDTSSLEEPS